MAEALISPNDEPPLSWAETRALMRSDFQRTIESMGNEGSALKRLFWRLLPTSQALFWHRISRHLFLRGWRNTAWIIFLVNTYLTRIEIAPTTSIGAGCFLGHAPVVLCGRIGRRFTLYGYGGLGGGMESRDIGGGSGLPVVGDDVLMAIRAMVLGPVRIGDGARIGPSCTVTRDVAARAVVASAPPRTLSTAAAADHPASNQEQP